MILPKKIIDYLPGLVVLIFSMIALYTTVSFIDLSLRHVTQSETHSQVLSHSVHAEVHKDLSLKSELLYWSVISLGFFGFILALLYARRLSDLKKMHEAKQNDLKDFSIRMAALEAARDGILILDKNRKIVYLNSSLQSILGVETSSREDLFGQSFAFLFSEEEYVVIEEDIFSELDKQDIWGGEFPFYRDDGSVLYTELSVTRIEGIGFVATFVDVTYRVDAEEEKRALQDQFYQAQKMEAIGRLAGGIAHDFNNILASMNGYAEFLIEDLSKDTDQHDFAKNILQAGMQAKALVNKMLAFSRKDDDVSEDVDILLSVEETISMLRATLSKSIDLHHHSSVFSAYINGNATQISQLLMNLGVNAQDAMDDDHGRLSISVDVIEADAVDLDLRFFEDDYAKLSDPPPFEIMEYAVRSSRLVLGQFVKGVEYVRIQVEDTGSGMTKNVLEKIFDPFFTTKSVDKGTGLGLATVHGLIASHRGCMIINTTLMEGTCFDLYFPLVKKEVSEVSVLHDEYEASPEYDRGRKRILLVEDQEDVRVMMMKMLNRIGYKAVSAVSGRDGLELVREDLGKYDLIITDQNMPEMTGLEMINCLHSEFPKIPFLMVSGYSESKIQEIVQGHPAVRDVLKKPVSKQALTERIDSILSEAA